MMTRMMIERKANDLGFWVLEVGNLFTLQKMATGEIFEEEYNLEGLENKLERLEDNKNDN